MVKGWWQSVGDPGGPSGLLFGCSLKIVVVPKGTLVASSYVEAPDSSYSTDCSH